MTLALFLPFYNFMTFLVRAMNGLFALKLALSILFIFAMRLEANLLIVLKILYKSLVSRF